MNYTKISEKEIMVWLKENLNEERYSHSLGTADTAKNLALKYGLDAEKAYTAGLLHDAAKCFPKEKSLRIIDEHLEIEETERENYKTIHAPVSAYIAKEYFGVTDSEILSAIRWHTIGKTGMSLFEKIIFLADKIEPNTRDADYRNELIKLLDEENGLDKALLKCYKMTIISLVERNLKICPLTIDIYNDLQRTLNV